MTGTNVCPPTKFVFLPPHRLTFFFAAILPIPLAILVPILQEKYPELLWRKNLNFGSGNGGCGMFFGSPGVDLNRNFDFQWGDQNGASSDPCAGDYHGPSAESEPETKAVSEYAKRLFPEGQRKADPEGEVDVSFGEDITGIYADIHAAGGYGAFYLLDRMVHSIFVTCRVLTLPTSSLSLIVVVYPWVFEDSKTPDDEALQALGRKIQSFNEYKLWAGSQPDLQYRTSGMTIDYMYATLGVASFGLEIGDDFYQECAAFEDEIVPINIPALLYAAKIAGAPYKEVKGPDVLDLIIGENEQHDKIIVSARASDGEMVNAITVDGRFKNFPTGDQSVAELRYFLDDGANSWTTVNLDEGDVAILETIDKSSLTPGRHTIHVQATDSDGYKGPISSEFFSVSLSNPPTYSPSGQSSALPTSDSSGGGSFLDDLLNFLSDLLDNDGS
jgi:carboxypeptidase T